MRRVIYLVWSETTQYFLHSSFVEIYKKRRIASVKHSNDYMIIIKNVSAVLYVEFGLNFLSRLPSLREREVEIS